MTLGIRAKVFLHMWQYDFSSPGRSPGRAIELPPASALALALAAASALANVKVFMFKVFYVMGKPLSGELSCPCDRSCYDMTLFTD